jgi:hypothetical protein
MLLMSKLTVKTDLHVYDGSPETLPPDDGFYYYFNSCENEFFIAYFRVSSSGDPVWTWYGNANPGDIWAEIPLPPTERAKALRLNFFKNPSNYE